MSTAVPRSCPAPIGMRRFVVGEADVPRLSLGPPSLQPKPQEWEQARCRQNVHGTMRQCLKPFYSAKYNFVSNFDMNPSPKDAHEQCSVGVLVSAKNYHKNRQRDRRLGSPCPTGQAGCARRQWRGPSPLHRANGGSTRLASTLPVTFPAPSHVRSPPSNRLS